MRFLLQSDEPRPAANGFDFRIVGSARDLEDLIRVRAAQGHSARTTAGFCWPWSDPLPDSSLVSDVVVDDCASPWNARLDSKRLAPGIKPASLWATDPVGLDLFLRH